MSVFGVILVGIFPAGKCRKSADQNNSEYGHFLRSVSLRKKWLSQISRFFKVFCEYLQVGHQQVCYIETSPAYKNLLKVINKQAETI